MLCRDLIKPTAPGDEEKFMVTMEEVPELAVDVVRFQKGVGRRLYDSPMVEPRLRQGVSGMGTCHFHVHEEGEVCYL